MVICHCVFLHVCVFVCKSMCMRCVRIWGKGVGQFSLEGGPQCSTLNGVILWNVLRETIAKLV